MEYVIYQSSTATELRILSDQEMVGFRKGIKMEETSYPTFKDETYFVSFSGSLYITSKSHECN